MILDAAVLVNPNNDTMWYSWVQPSGMVLWDSKANTYIYIHYNWFCRPQSQKWGDVLAMIYHGFCLYLLISTVHHFLHTRVVSYLSSHWTSKAGVVNPCQLQYGNPQKNSLKMLKLKKVTYHYHPLSYFSRILGTSSILLEVAYNIL